ncbi:Hypothetical Protein RSKD131_4290 [Cereibacter sphaeroides KD131]|nr:Hypothetical Protein RSKD131_4290 [Cereibacter sphaeroides KD131]
MRRNLRTALRTRVREHPMLAHDRLHPAARIWVTQAVLPWSAASVRRIWSRALARSGSESAALAALAAAEAATLAREARLGASARGGQARHFAPHPAALVPAAPPRAEREAGRNSARPPQL